MNQERVRLLLALAALLVAPAEGSVTGHGGASMPALEGRPARPMGNRLWFVLV
jgi:hypothetical protein